MTVITSSVDLAVHIVKSHFSKRLSTYPVLDWSSPVQSDKHLRMKAHLGSISERINDRIVVIL